MNIPKFSVKRPVTVIMALLIVAALGRDIGNVAFHSTFSGYESAVCCNIHII